MVADHQDEHTPAELASQFMEGMELVLVEGYKASKGDKIEVVRAERATKPMLRPEDGLIAPATDLSVDIGVPSFGLDDPAPIADFLIERYLST